MALFPRRLLFGVVSSCLVLTPSLAFPETLWTIGSSGRVYSRVASRSEMLDSLRSQLSGLKSTFGLDSSSSVPAVSQSLDVGPYLVRDANTGEVIGRVLPSVTRDISLSDVASAAVDVIEATPDGRLASLATTGLGVLATLLLASESGSAPLSSPSSSSTAPTPPISASNPYYGPNRCSIAISAGNFYADSPLALAEDICGKDGLPSGPGVNSAGNGATCGGESLGQNCSGTPSDVAPPGYGSVSPSDVLAWAKAHPRAAVNAIRDAMLKNPDLAPEIAQEIAPYDPPLSDPLPFDYDISPNPDIIRGPVRTVSRETRSVPLPSSKTGTGTETITKTEQPVDTLRSGPGGLTEDQTIVRRTTTCIDGSCNTSTTVENISSSQARQNRLDHSPFVPPPFSPLTPPPVVHRNIPLSLSVPSSVGVCPPPVPFVVMGRSYSLSYAPFCRIALAARPYVMALGGVGAAIVILR